MVYSQRLQITGVLAQEIAHEKPELASIHLIYTQI